LQTAGREQKRKEGSSDDKAEVRGFVGKSFSKRTSSHQAEERKIKRSFHYLRGKEKGRLEGKKREPGQLTWGVVSYVRKEESNEARQ